ncbi:hypothetical protein CI266_005038 [Salmonella enterica subsp. enterica serovar Kotte]|nr:hypothetical protein [Salmonella enterica subsp. enterica serovar Kotte]
MGYWSIDPWGNDVAADWFHRFWGGADQSDFDFLIHEIIDFDPSKERYDSVRAACYVLQVIGIVYVWPVNHLDMLKELINRAIIILSNMINPPDDTWFFLDDCDNDEDVINSVNEQIRILKLRLSELV